MSDRRTETARGDDGRAGSGQKAARVRMDEGGCDGAGRSAGEVREETEGTRYRGVRM